MDVPPSRPTPQTPMGPMKLTLGVEESRAHRHQRQQSRFRDRGGIFKPSNRNTLVDILMGRRAPSPRKSMRRSASYSPSKRDKTPSRPDVDKTRVSCNDSAVSPTKTKTPRKTRSLVPPQATLEENRTAHLHESQAEETSAGNCPCLATLLELITMHDSPADGEAESQDLKAVEPNRQREREQAKIETQNF
ncbi:hypothetical protein F5887DRAFT_91053 [Amanita rubescens]|nr:hypothetical protein F5887DRAFT_91053 [Amanita rubescens]